ncbi:MAG: carbamoyltransferase C-terminal domain-containing protein [Vicinamibacterales bacterium]
MALAERASVMGVCQQERVTRVRSAGFNASGLPDEALDTLLQRLGRSRHDVGRYVAGEPDGRCAGADTVERIDHHFAHACAAYLSSPFTDATILVCDHEAPKVSVWSGRGGEISSVEWPWRGPGFADVYSRGARAFGFRAETGDQRLEALARLRPDARDARVERLLTGDGTSVTDHALERSLEQWLAGERHPGSASSAALAASLQARIGELVLELLAEVRRRTGSAHLCLAGSLFYHSSINTLAKRAGIFDEVFVPIDPGNAGLAVGTALHANRCAPRPVSPFLGPSYSAYETKEILDNCKLQYSWESEENIIAVAVRALQSGTLVGWFDGPMEWGPRALGARCILANPFAPYVLENLNHFLKGREPWRGYAVSGLEAAVADHFDGPATAPFMESDYRPRDAARFRNVLPSPDAAIRVHTVGSDALPRFTRLLEAFGSATGAPFLVNTSFNGFHEPIVCSPRDAVRVFYGSGLDLLVLDQFVLRK